MPPTKQAPNSTPPPPPPPKPAAKPLPPLPPPKPAGLASPPEPEQLQDDNGVQDLPSPLRSPDGMDGGGEAADGELEVGSMVEVNDPPLFGVIRWVGRIGGVPEQVAGIELVRQR